MRKVAHWKTNDWRMERCLDCVVGVFVGDWITSRNQINDICFFQQTAWQFKSTKCLGMIVKICAGCPTFIIFVEEFRMSSCCTGKGRHVDLFDECSFQLQKKINCH